MDCRALDRYVVENSVVRSGPYCSHLILSIEEDHSLVAIWNSSLENEVRNNGNDDRLPVEVFQRPYHDRPSMNNCRTRP